ncbi:hypothetical protein F3X87_16020 [Aeromonas caviae]|uniref:hypothetical protein n=1 Tax=Aeromonas caviae TaxID=648 RepID=UPI001247E0E0|nr:hypothetical protein [Aeromonas caviae]KAB0676134.1 hypothetical protein F3X87_16020 [Aeromonas caviae]
MDRFLVNMAIVRVNWNKNGTDLLDNYMPLVHEALDKMDGDVFSVDIFKEKFIEISEFKIPTGAAISLIKRAIHKHDLLEKQPKGIYRIKRDKIKNDSFSKIRDAEQRKYNALVQKFITYCGSEHSLNINESDASTYFFEVLYDLAPALFLNINEAEKIKDFHSDKNKYLVSKFVAHSNTYDQTSFDAILSFVRGSMLTETFYYSQNTSDITNKPLRKVIVYLDTQFLIKALGFSQRELCIPCDELIEMLREMDVKTRCFRNTLEELHGIFFAALNQLTQYGHLNPNRPSDVFDYINSNSVTPADLLITMNSLEEKLNNIGVYVEEKPEIIEAYAIDQASLSKRLSAEFVNQSQKAQHHDIDCLQSVFQLREGRRQEYLDRCKAIFITTNSQLARLSTIFFNEQYGHSNAPVCMGDHVFTSLVWMKSVKKTANLPKDRLVANCYSALLPSNSLWSEYIREVNRLKDRGEISEHDYHVLIHSMAAREQLMEQAFSSDDNMFGSIETILDKAKKLYTEEIGERLDVAERTIELQRNNIDNLISMISSKISNLTLFVTIVLWGVALIYALIYTSPDSLKDLININYKSCVFMILVIITVSNLIFGFRLFDMCKTISNKAGHLMSEKLKKMVNNANQ